MHKLLPLACLLGAASAHGQVTPPDPATTGRPAASSAASPVVPSVTVAGSRANDTQTRQLSTAAKMVFGREELDRNGDSSVGEILKRLPGITLGGPPGRGGGGGVRMRGLGNGYTQMLVNGERPPAGFSLESLAPDQVERIEVMRGPVAEHSTQAIAGTINIILREGYQQKDVQLRLADNVEGGRHSPDLSLTAPYKIGDVSVLLNASVSHNRNGDESSSFSQEELLDGTVVRQQRIASTSERDSKSLRLAPRFSYRFANGDTLNFQQFIATNRGHTHSQNLLTQTVGTAPYALSQGYSTGENTFFRGFGNWLHRMEAGAKLDVKFGFGGGNNRNDSERVQFDDRYVLRNRYDDRSAGKQRGVSFGGKYTAPIGKGHLLAVGWDTEAQTREQTSVSLANGVTRFAGSGDNLEAATRRVALFAQDEWDITPQWSVYFGLRWEGIRTTSERQAGSGAMQVKSTTSVWSPVLHGVWRIPGSEKDQIRASLTQSYRAPQLNDLIAAPSFSLVADDPNNPDRSGNPDLKPELARGIDLAYEHYLGKSGILSASAFVRKIDDLMRRDLRQYRLGNEVRWISTPSNIGSARTSGIELEAKFQLAELYPNAPNVDLRANYSRFWSDVDGIPGPDNRLDGQAEQTANIGVDYRLKGMPLTLGGNFNWTPATPVQVSASERAFVGVKRQGDVYALWKFSANTQLRLSANNLGEDDYLGGRYVSINGSTPRLATSLSNTRTYTTWGARLEMKL